MAARRTQGTEPASQRAVHRFLLSRAPRQNGDGQADTGGAQAVGRKPALRRADKMREGPLSLSPLAPLHQGPYLSFDMGFQGASSYFLQSPRWRAEKLMLMLWGLPSTFIDMVCVPV